MLRGIGILVILLSFFDQGLTAQELTQQVLVPAAGLASPGTISYSQTIGEAAVEIFNTPEKDLTQGFQQPLVKLVKDNRPPGDGVKVYPNPATDFVNIELFGDRSRDFKLEIITVSGTILKKERLTFNDAFWWVKRIPTEQFSKGLYLIRVVSDDGIINRTFKIDIM